MRLLENEELGHSVEAADWETKYKKKTIDEIRTDLRKAYDESQDTSVMTKAEKVERAKRKHAFLAKKLVLVEEQEEFKHEAQACDTGDLEHMSNSLQAELNHAMRNIKEMVNEELPANAKRLSMSPRLSLKGRSGPSPRLSIFAAQLADLRDSHRREQGGASASLDSLMEGEEFDEAAQAKLEAKLAPAFTKIEEMASKQRKLDYMNRELERRARNFGEFVEESS